MYLLNPIKSYEEEGVIGFIITLTIWTIVGLFIATLVALSEVFWKPLFFDLKYSSPIKVTVMVHSKRIYNTTRTNMISTGKSVIPMTTISHHYEVTLKNGNHEIIFDNETLYDIASINEQGTLSFQEEYWKWKWEDGKKYTFNKNTKFQFNGNHF